MSSIVFKEEFFDEVVEDFKTLMGDHYKEIALYQSKVPLDPDFDFYEALNKEGIISFYTARDEGVLIGYFFVIIKAHPHYKSTKCGFNDLLFVKKEYRNLSVGKGLISFVEDSLKDKDVSLLYINTKTHQPFDTLMTISGYECVERVYSKYLGE